MGAATVNHGLSFHRLRLLELNNEAKLARIRLMKNAPRKLKKKLKKEVKELEYNDFLLTLNLFREHLT